MPARPTVDDAEKAEQIFVSPDSGLDLTRVFSCEDGEFDVFWSGIVDVPGTIYIGSGTTVRIFGGLRADGSNISNSNSSLGEGSSVNDQQRVEVLSTRLPQLPNNLSAVAVSTYQHRQNQSITATTSSWSETGAAETTPGPIFFVDGGQLFLERLAVRGGYAATVSEISGGDGGGSGDSSGSSGSSGSGAVLSGGGLHALDANVSVTECEFEDNFSEYLGGGIFTNRSTLVVTASVFRGCQADVQSSPGDDAFGAGGGIGVRLRAHVSEKIIWSKDSIGCHFGL